MSFNAVPRKGVSFARDGHQLGDFPKRTSIGNGKRKRGSFKSAGKKKYVGQGKR